MGGKPGIMLHYETMDCLEAMSDAQLGQLLRATMDYAKDGTEPSFDDIVLKSLWPLLRQTADRDEARYRRRVEQGKKAARSRWENRPEEPAAAPEAEAPPAHAAATGEAERTATGEAERTADGTMRDVPSSSSAPSAPSAPPVSSVSSAPSAPSAPPVSSAPPVPPVQEMPYASSAEYVQQKRREYQAQRRKPPRKAYGMSAEERKRIAEEWAQRRAPPSRGRPDGTHGMNAAEKWAQNLEIARDEKGAMP